MMHDLLPRCITGIFLGVLAVAACLLCPPLVTSLALVVMFAYIAVAEWPALRAWPLFPLYPTVPFFVLILLNSMESRAELLLLLVFVYGHDTGGYIFGNLFGRHKLAPAVSPGKSWEGFVGGLVTSLVSGWLVSRYVLDVPWLKNLPWYVWLTVAGMINIAAVFGDLFESWLKRRVNVKNSGSLLPGHGGLLDRLDSLLTSVCVWALYRYVSTLFL